MIFPTMIFDWLSTQPATALGPILFVAMLGADYLGRRIRSSDADFAFLNLSRLFE
jgi:hypothetical protein